MDNKIIDGKNLAATREAEIKRKVANSGITPNGVNILIGDDPSSVLYTQIKEKKAKELGINFQTLRFTHAPGRCDREVLPEWNEVVNKIKELNEDKNIHGLMIQLPLPKEFLGNHQTEELLRLIDPQKDIDGLNYARKVGPYVPAAVKAVLSILEDENIEVVGKQVVVVGASDLVGKPAALELEKRGAKVKICDKGTVDLKQCTLQADVLISATGVPGLITGDMVKNGMVVIDIGAEKVDGKLLGDVDFASVYPLASKITPVPGGVGPMTVIALMENMVQAVYNNK